MDLGLEFANNSRETLSVIHHADDTLLRKLGYKSEFKREFSVRVQFDTAYVAATNAKPAASRDNIFFACYFGCLLWYCYRLFLPSSSRSETKPTLLSVLM